MRGKKIDKGWQAYRVRLYNLLIYIGRWPEFDILTPRAVGLP